MTTARARAVLWPIAMLMLAMLLTSLHFAMAEPWRLASFEKMASFEAAEPFQHRILLPALVAALHAILPVGIELLFALLELAAWVALFVVAYRGLALLEVGASDLMRRILALTFAVPMALHLIVPNLQFRPPYEVEGQVFELGSWHTQALFYYPYDLPAALFTLALVLMMVRIARDHDRRWLMAYIGLFAIATFNRETTMLLIPTFAAVFYRTLPRGLFIKALAAQVALIVVIQGSLQWVFADHLNPSAAFPVTAYEYYLVRNFKELANPLYLMTFLPRFAAGAYIPLLLLRSRLDPVIGRSLIFFGIPLLGIALTVGRIQELRIVIEIVPLLWLGALQVLADQRFATAAQAPPAAVRTEIAGGPGLSVASRSGHLQEAAPGGRQQDEPREAEPGRARANRL